jgi:hypothetical protein
VRIIANPRVAFPPVVIEGSAVDIGPSVAHRVNVVFAIDGNSIADIDVACVDVDIAYVRPVAVSDVDAIAGVDAVAADLGLVADVGAVPDVCAISGPDPDIRPVPDVLVSKVRPQSRPLSRQTEEIAEFV